MLKKSACLVWGLDREGGEILSGPFLKGAIAQGYEVALQEIPDPLPDLVAFWGYRDPIPERVARLQELGVEVLIVEAGYINRGQYYQVGRGRINWIPDDAPGDRFKKLKVKRIAKRQPGDHVLFCGQVPGDSQHNMNSREMITWQNKTIAELRNNTDREIVYRPHPRTVEFTRSGPLVGPVGVDRISDPGSSLHGELKDCHCLVTFNSTAALFALLDGVPVFSDPSAFYGELTTHDLKKLERPRWRSSLSFFNRLAYGQWSLGELETGAPLNYLQKTKEPENGPGEKDGGEKGETESPRN